MSGAPAIRVANLTKVFAGETVLDLDDLALEAGRVHVLIGGNGAGKTTLLRILAGLELPTTGVVEVLGTDPYATSRGQRRDLQRRVTLCFQNPYLFHSSVRRNIDFGLRARGVSVQDRNRRVGAAAEALGLTHLLDRAARTLSGGESKRVSLARALVLRPEVMLMDEPLANVDAVSVFEVEAAIRDLLGQGSTLVIATHQLDQAYRLSADVVRLERGRVAPSAVDNLLDGEIIQRGETTFLLAGSGVEIRVMTNRSGPARAAVDPSAVLVSREAVKSSAQNAFPGRVTALQERGTGILVTADVGIPLQALITQESLRSFGFTIGSEVILTFKAASVTVF